MSTEATSDARFQIGHVLFIDIVGYSKLLVNDQTKSLRELNEVVQGTGQFRLAEKRNRLVRIPTGDGMALVFRDSPEVPVRCALEINRALKKRRPPVPIRMGIHSGLVNEVTDVNNRTNVAGPGINIAQRVMDCGDAGHILLSKHVAEDLEHHARWRLFLHDLGQCEVKHRLKIGLVNFYNSEDGNPQVPEKIRRTRKKQAASSVFLFSTTAALALVIVAGSLFFLNRFPKPEAAVTTPAETTPSASSPTATATGTPDLILANTRMNDSVWAQPLKNSPKAQPRKLFAGTWRGTLHSVGPKGVWDSNLELNVDDTETHLSNMTAGSVFRQGRTLIYKRSYKLGRSTSVQVKASLEVNEDDRTATYISSQTSLTGKSESVTVGKGTLEKSN